MAPVVVKEEASNGHVTHEEAQRAYPAHQKRTFNGIHKPVVRQEDSRADQTQFLERISKMLVEKAFKRGNDVAHSKVVNFLHPSELNAKFDFTIREKGEDDDLLMGHCDDVIKYSVKTGHPYFFNQLYQGQDQYGLAGSWLTETLNTSQFTYEVSPVFTLMEHSVLKKMRDIVGYTGGDGIFCPGGSVSNMYGVNLGRYKLFPEIKDEGMHALPKLVMFTSEQCHYSIMKSAAVLGVGVKNCKKVKTTKNGCMDPADLRQQILDTQEEGSAPFLVVATCGTTVIGAYDPLPELSAICEEFGLWLHVDCCWGGGVLLSRKHRHKMTGIEKADSIAWNPHKLMSAPLQCCAFLTKHEGLLKACYSANASYLFQKDKFYDVSFDTGDKSIQCSRRVDVFKLWLMWKHRGDLGFERDIDSLLDRAQYFADRIKKHAGFELLFDNIQCTNICFWYIPPSMRGQERTEEWWQRLHQVAPKIKEQMMLQGTMLVGYQPLNTATGNYVNFWRLVVGNFKHTDDDMDYVMNEIERLGKDL